MAYDDGFYYGQCKIICESESVDDKVVALVGNGKNYSDRLVNKKAEFLVPGRTEYTVSLLDGSATLWSGTVYAGYGECIHVMLADGYEPVIEKDFQPIKNNLTASNGVNFKFGIDSNGRYGYIKDGADSVTPFNPGFALNLGGLYGNYLNKTVDSWGAREYSVAGGASGTVDVKAAIAAAGMSNAIDYKKLTDNDFVLELKELRGGAKIDVTQASRYANPYPDVASSIVKSYNATSGVLTVTCSYAAGACEDDGPVVSYPENAVAYVQAYGTARVTPWLVITRTL